MSQVPANQSDGGFMSSAPQRGGSYLDVAMSRAAQEVQAAMVIAKKFPRDEHEAFKRIQTACQRKNLAEMSIYSYPRGGSKVDGPSIRLAEVLAQSWGNMDSGVIELERKDGESIAMSYCWDLETNTRDTKIFTVKHIRDRSERKGGNVALTDERDIYELIANMGARRKRACILAIIPGDVVDMALAECDKTMAGNNKEPLVDRVRAAVTAFSDFGVSIEMIEKRFGHKLDATTENELVQLRKVYRSLKDDMGTVGDFFDVGGAGDAKTSVEDRLAAAAAKKKASGKPSATVDTGAGEVKTDTAKQMDEALDGKGDGAAAEKAEGKGEPSADEQQRIALTAILVEYSGVEESVAADKLTKMVPKLFKGKTFGTLTESQVVILKKMIGDDDVLPKRE